MLVTSLLALDLLAALAALDPAVLGHADDVALTPSTVAYVEARHSETVIRGRPWVPHKRVATIASGTRLVVAGEVASRDPQGCHGKPWYAVRPFGFVCSEHVRASKLPPEPGTALPPLPGRRVPHNYAIVRNDGVPAYASVADVRAGIIARELADNMSLVVDDAIEIDGAGYYRTRNGQLVPRESVGWMGQGSAWQGVVLDGFAAGPAFAWTAADKTVVRDRPDTAATALRTLAKRVRVPLVESSGTGRERWWRIGENAWISATELNEVIVVDPPDGVSSAERQTKTGNDQWVDVDVGEQVLVAYNGSTPVFATLVASGKSSPTPLGDYPVWAKVASMDMANQDWEDKPFMVQGVPWVLLFQGHNAIHGAYWHDRFGARRSHGCVNVAPIDAKWLFDWIGPTLPKGWTGYLPEDLTRAPVVHVRDSARTEGMQFTQERPIGPPDREAERRKTEAAEKRRAAATEADVTLDEPLWPEPAPR